jgi:hypothetical protein
MVSARQHFGTDHAAFFASRPLGSMMYFLAAPRSNWR